MAQRMRAYSPPSCRMGCAALCFQRWLRGINCSSKCTGGSKQLMKEKAQRRRLGALARHPAEYSTNEQAATMHEEC